MSNIEFVLSLTPEQIWKFIGFNTKKDLMIGIIKDKKRLSIYDTKKNFRMDYTWINDKWKADYE